MLAGHPFLLARMIKNYQSVNSHGSDFYLTEACIYVHSDRRILSESFCWRVSGKKCVPVDDRLDPESLVLRFLVLHQSRPIRCARSACRSTTRDYLRSLLVNDRW